MPSKDVEEALRDLFQSISLEKTLTDYAMIRNNYGDCFVPVIQVDDPDGLLDEQPRQNR